MKGIHPLIGAVLVIVVSVSAIITVLYLGSPAISRTQETLLLQEGKNILISIDGYIKDVSNRGEESTRSLSLSTTGGNYFIDIETETVMFLMESKLQIIGVGVSKLEDNINITGEIGKVYLNLSYINIDITDGGSFGKGTHTLVIKNNGYNSTTQKQIISVKVVR
jgi:hypothetical protein